MLVLLHSIYLLRVRRILISETERTFETKFQSVLKSMVVVAYAEPPSILCVFVLNVSGGSLLDLLFSSSGA